MSASPGDTRFVVALTGGIGSGKTAVSDRLAALGADVVDTDQLAREVVLPGEPALAAIAAHFGAEMLLPDGTLDRPRLRELVFSEPAAKRWLDDLLHPLIRQRLHQRLTAGTGPYAVAVIPLLAESGQTEGYDRILLVDVPEDLQIDRVVARDGVSREQAQAALRNQAGRSQRLRIADDVLNNDGELASLMEAVDSLHARYCAAAAEKAQKSQ